MPAWSVRFKTVICRHVRFKTVITHTNGKREATALIFSMVVNADFCWFVLFSLFIIFVSMKTEDRALLTVS